MADTQVDIATQAMTFFTASNGWQVAIHESPCGPRLIGGSPEGICSQTYYRDTTIEDIVIVEALMPDIKNPQTRAWLAAACEFYRHLLDV